MRGGRNLGESTLPLGQVVDTPVALERIDVEVVRAAFHRNIPGDWGLVSADDNASNEVGIKERSRVQSAFDGADGTRFWVITEWPHLKEGRTTVLLAE